MLILVFIVSSVHFIYMLNTHTLNKRSVFYTLNTSRIVIVVSREETARYLISIQVIEHTSACDNTVYIYI